MDPNEGTQSAQQGTEPGGQPQGNPSPDAAAAPGTEPQGGTQQTPNADPQPQSNEPQPDESEQLRQLQARNTQLQNQLDQMRRDHLSQEERTRIELDERETNLSRREESLRHRENQLYAVGALETAGLCAGGMTTQEMLPFVMESTTAGIDRKVEALKALLDKAEQAMTQKYYDKISGQPQQPRGSTSGGSGSTAALSFGKERAEADSRAAEIRKKYTGGI